MTTPQETPEFVWAAEMPLLTNRFFLYDAVKLLFWVAVVFSAILLVCAAFAGSLGKIDHFRRNKPRHKPYAECFTLFAGPRLLRDSDCFSRKG